MNQKQFEQEVYLEAEAQWSFIEFWIMVIDDIKAGRLKYEDIPQVKKPTIKKRRKENKLIKVKGNARKLIDANLKISEVAIRYGIKLEKNNKIICPFHDDTDPSLSLDDELNVFYCFGCQETGDIINFVGRLEEWKEKTQQKKH